MSKCHLLIVSVFVIAVLLSVGLAKAVSIDFYGIDVDVLQDRMSAKLTVTFDSKLDSFRLPIGSLKAPIKILQVSANQGSAECKPVVDQGKTSIDCVVKGAMEGRNTITMLVDPLNRLDILEDKKTASIDYEFPFETKSLAVSYKLPERAALSEDPPEKSILPRNGDIKTDGKKIFIFWNRQNISAGDILTFSVSYTLPDQADASINTFLLLPIIIILSVLVWFVIRHKKTTRTVGENAVVSVLSREEKALFDILKANNGRVNQKVLVRESNFSKAKVSRLVKELKERGVVEIEPVSGRENRVLLKLGQPKEKAKKEIQEPPEAKQEKDRKPESEKSDSFPPNEESDGV